IEFKILLLTYKALHGQAPSYLKELIGLRPGVPSVRPPPVFVSPTKLASEAGSQVEYLGANRVPDLQKVFQRSDGVPVHLKRGLIDKLLYRTTMGLTVGGALYCLVALYIAAQPRNKHQLLADQLFVPLMGPDPVFMSPDPLLIHWSHQSHIVGFSGIIEDYLFSLCLYNTINRPQVSCI
uniref:Uncharacterized protein n=1 Tax=Dicentrarchus labrax TaxID=13489 RepID=A0A8C4EEX6_DICLA